jgi:transcriptional regulator with XRE-family HTH domain
MSSINESKRFKIAEIIKSTRKSMNITQEDFGKKISGNDLYYSRQSIYQWEKGIAVPGRASLMLMSQNKEKWIRDLAEQINNILEVNK